MEMGVFFDSCPVQMKIRILRRKSLLRQVSKQRRNGIVNNVEMVLFLVRFI